MSYVHRETRNAFPDTDGMLGKVDQHVRMMLSKLAPAPLPHFFAKELLVQNAYGLRRRISLEKVERCLAFDIFYHCHELGKQQKDQLL